MKFFIAVALWLALPSLALAQSELDVTQKAAFGSTTVPVHAVFSTGSTSRYDLSQTKKAGAVPVTITFYITPKPPPPPPKAATSSQAAAVESSQGIQDGIAGVSPQAASIVEPVFTLIDAGRDQAANIINGQLAKAKAAVGQGSVLGTETVGNASKDPGGTFWRILQTLYLYILTILGFVVNSAAVFYPVFAIAILFVIWKLFSRFRR